MIQWRGRFEAQVSSSQVCAVLGSLRPLNGEVVEPHKGSDTLRTKHMKGQPATAPRNGGIHDT